MRAYQGPHKVGDIARHYSLEEKDDALTLGAIGSLIASQGCYSFKVLATQQGYFWIITEVPEGEIYQQSLERYQDHQFREGK